MKDDWFLSAFGEWRELAAALLPHAIDADANDGSHDLAHLMRVWRNAQRIMATDGGDAELIVAAVLLHDCVAVEKDSPLREQASRLAAQKGREVLHALGWPAQRCEQVAHAVEAHSFSAGVEPRSLEARILQDADRLDALGLLGVARCFYTAGRMGSTLYSPDDPAGEHRPLDDRRHALDHFPRKLLRLSEGFRTQGGMALAQQRHRRLLDFYQGFLDEVAGGTMAVENESP
ncbi:MAG: HD domain-containing protein [Lautropia sp.]|nr:HD domain-containing protein [Lautropia sp.]